MNLPFPSIIEPHIRQLIYLYTAWTKDGDESSMCLHSSWHDLVANVPIYAAFTVTRMLTQTLSNLVTGNQELLDQFWNLQMQISEDKSILM